MATPVLCLKPRIPKNLLYWTQEAWELAVVDDDMAAKAFLAFALAENLDSELEHAELHAASA